jgi:hypothetical protein
MGYGELERNMHYTHGKRKRLRMKDILLCDLKLVNLKLHDATDLPQSPESETEKDR